MFRACRLNICLKIVLHNNTSFPVYIVRDLGSCMVSLKSHDRVSRNMFPLSFMKDQVSFRTSLLSNFVPPLHPLDLKG